MKYSLVLLVLLATAVQAEVYKSINSKGEVIYSDVPSQGAERVQMPALTTYKPAPLPALPESGTETGTETAAAEAADYTSFQMTRPRDDETIRSNAGIVNIAVALEPALQVEAGHRVRFLIDGKPQGEPLAGVSTSFRNVDRGTHSVAAAVVDESGTELIAATPVTIHLLRTSVLQPSNPLNPGNRARDGGDAGSDGGGNNGDSSSNSSDSTSSSSSSSSSSSTSATTGPGTGGAAGDTSRSAGF